jgi:Protein of unknown function (DUF1214)
MTMVESTEGAAWSELLRGLDSLGRHVTSDDFPGPPVDPDEALRHVAQQTLCWLGWAVGHADPTMPAFQRQNDLVTMWGGPNADNVYRHARVDPGCTYRIRGRMRSCDEFALAIREGFRHTETPATLTELSASDIGIGPGDEFDLLLGGEGSEPHRVPLLEDAVMCSIREYYYDWRPEEPATFTIECLGGEPVRARPDFAAATHEALDLTERSIVFWNRYMLDARAKQPDNTFGDKVDVPRGLQLSQFGFCFYDLAPGEALHVHAEVPDARYWSLQLYTMAWFEPYDIGRVTSRNHTQMHVGDDARFHLVVAHDDPGVPNWLDTEGRRQGLLNFRYFWGTTLPTLATEVVPLDRVRDTLPPGTPVVDASARTAEVGARRDHLAWRFRT